MMVYRIVEREFSQFELQLWILSLWNFDKCSNNFKFDDPFAKIFLFLLESNLLYGITMFVLLMNGQPQALQQLPVSVVNLVMNHDSGS